MSAFALVLLLLVLAQRVGWIDLVFRPRTEPKGADAAVGDDAIDRILGPLPPPNDPLELLIEGSAYD